MLAALAAGVVSGVSVLAPNTQGVLPTGLTAQAGACVPSPQVTFIYYPNRGPSWGGSAVTISGCGFTGSTSVAFGSTNASGFTIDSDRQITASAPKHAPGTVDITVTTPSGTSATSVADQFTFFVACNDVTQSTAPASPQPVGTQVVITATAGKSLCPNPMFEFWILYPGSQTWQSVQGYLFNPTYNWDTASLPTGQYEFIVMVRDRDSPGTGGGNYLVSWDVVAYLYYTLSRPTAITSCTGVSVSASPPAPQHVGTHVAFTASATACPHPRYEFWIVYTSSQTWHLAQAYSASSTYNLNTSDFPGDYRLSAWARDATSPGLAGDSLGTWDAYNASSYRVNDPTACTGVSASVMPHSPQPPGTSVSVKGVATGCPNPTYAFFVFNPNTNSWDVGQWYSASATFTWDTTGLLGGTYRFSVWAQDAASFGIAGDVLGTWDAYTSLSYTLTSTPCTSVTAASSPPGIAPVGSPVTITVHALGCPNPAYEFWMWTPNFPSWQGVQLYSPSPTFNWKTAGIVKGVYRFSIWARDASSPGTAGNFLGTWDTYVAFTYTLS